MSVCGNSPLQSKSTAMLMQNSYASGHNEVLRELNQVNVGVRARRPGSVLGPGHTKHCMRMCHASTSCTRSQKDKAHSLVEG